MTLRELIEGARAGKIKVEAAAIMLDGVIYTLPPPARHHTVMKWMQEHHGIEYIGGNAEQGFVITGGKFLRRKPACIVAQEAKQFLGGVKPTNPRDELFSEDVW